MNYIENLKQKITYETLEKLYCQDLLSIKDCSETLNTTYCAIKKLISEYNLVQDKHAAKGKKNSEVKNREYLNLKETITKDILYKYYIEEDHNYDDTFKHFNITEWTFDRLLKDYNIKKDKKETCKKGLQTKYKNAGSKEKYFSDLDKKRKENIIKNYGSLENYYSQVVENMRKTTLEKYKVVNTSMLRETAVKRSETRKQCKSLDGKTFDSSWEKDIYEYCVRNNIPITVGPTIQFEYNGKPHTTHIDFNIDGINVEVKGSHLLAGCFDYRKGVIPINKKLEIFRQNNVVVITDKISKNLFLPGKGFKYDDNALIGIDIDLFINPKFPFRVDRPECFYKVKVNNQLSCFDAFNDEKLRWKMIKNRIKYVGGYIDNKAILTAMNVTRICKQPSWFSKEFAKNIISKYITSDQIIDTFAGWGMRCEAASELNVNYLGVDLNKELVDWHQKLNRNIIYEDATNFKYDKECSVFICPPYQDVEVYFEGQNCKLTQCQWLQIIMQNIPNAKEYVMVCKIVDEGWEKFIVEEKINKSHFGQNKEYVILINQEDKKTNFK